jgi:phosphatidylserine decarboxylase
MSHHSPHFPLSLYGWTFWVPILITGTLSTLVAAVLPAPAACIVGTTFAVLTLAGLAFYRDFPRQIPQDPDIMVAPADGTVSEISRLDHYAPFNGPALKIGIFLSIFSVHVNRSPCDGTVLWTRYEEGLFLDARHPDCSAKNQSNTLALGSGADSPVGSSRAFTDPTTPISAKDASSRTPNPYPLSPNPSAPIAVVKQIVGTIARRIIAPVAPGDRLARGQRFGMIAFGSRTELYVPTQDNWQPAVKLGDGVKAGSSILLRK